MKRYFKCFITLSLLAAIILPGSVAKAQTGIYIPSKKPVKNMQKAMIHPDRFCLLLQYSGSSTDYNISDLDWLDSVYRVAFADRSNPKLYAITIEGYSSSEELSENRVDKIYNYFANRCYAPFPIRYALNPISCNCHGDTVETVRYEVPVTRKAYRTADLPESRRTFNQNINLDNCVLISLVHDPDACLGAARGCAVPSMDTTIRGYYASVFMKRGALYNVENTKDSCPSNIEFRIEEHLEYKPIVEEYFLVPHRKQFIVQVGYIVLHSSIKRSYGECSSTLPDSIYVRFPVTQEQIDNKIRIFGKKYSEKGVEYKALTTKKMPSKVSLSVQASVNSMQLDTIFLGKRIQPEEMDDYFFECKTDMEDGSFSALGKHWKAYRLDRHGNYEIKKPLRALMRIVEDEVDEIEDSESDNRYKDDEEIE
ncbi:MAG: hypothetical protein J6Y98_02335 [Bacteroidales bacterium]|nr:hypothetical protein [Bacteroidales bacterium]